MLFILKWIYKNIFSYFATENFRIAKINVRQDKKYIDMIFDRYKKYIKNDDFKSYFYRSYLQYKCKIYKIGITKLIIVNLVSTLLIPFLFIISLFTKFFIKNEMKEHEKNIGHAVLAICPYEGLLFQNIEKRFKVLTPTIGFMLDLNGLKYIKYIVINFFQPYFIFSMILKISYYNYLCCKYNPDAIIATSEYSFSSSILTAYLNKKGILHIGMLHGDKLFNIRDSFFRFNEFWVYDPHYVSMFKRVYAYKNQFIIGKPIKHEILIKQKNIKNNKKILKYYWSLERDKNELQYLTQGLEKLRMIGFQIIIRYHPSMKAVFTRWCKKYFINNFTIENPEELDICTSLEETNFVLGTCTTVLYEAYLMGKQIVINDYNDNLQALKNLEYIMVNGDKKFILFSELLEKYNIFIK